MAATDRLAKLNSDQIRITQAAFVELQATYTEIRDGFKIFSGAAADKDAQIERLRQGGDKQVYLQFLRRFIRVLRLIESDVDEDRSAGKDTSSLESIRNHLLDALADAGAESFEPPSGADYRKRNDVADRPRIVPTTDPNCDWTITKTIRAGFRVQAGGDPMIIERAEVEIQRHRI